MSERRRRAALDRSRCSARSRGWPTTASICRSSSTSDEADELRWSAHGEYEEAGLAGAPRRPAPSRSTAPPRRCARRAGDDVAYDELVLATGSVPVRAAGRGRDTPRLLRLPHHRGSRGDPRLRPAADGTRAWSSAAGCSASRRPTRCATWAWRRTSSSSRRASCRCRSTRWAARSCARRIEGLGVRVHTGNRPPRIIAGDGDRVAGA